MAVRQTTVGFLLVLLPLSTIASFCGPASVPFSFESLPDGRPVLGCARPRCFGSGADGKPAGNPATFYRIAGKPDGYFRKNTEAQPSAIPAIAEPYFHSQVANSKLGVGNMRDFFDLNDQVIDRLSFCCNYDPHIDAVASIIAAHFTDCVQSNCSLHNNDSKEATRATQKLLKDCNVKYVVYLIRCKNCRTFLYCGYTTQPLRKRMFQHIKENPNRFYCSKCVGNDFTIHYILHYLKRMLQKCASTYDSDQCNGENSWVGGIGPLVNVSALPLALQCCEYEPLKHSADRGIAVVNPGQIVLGGEIQNGQRVYAFDYISDVTKRVKADGTVSYDVAVRRMPCVPQPHEFAVDIEDKVYEEISSRFVRVEKHGKGKGALAFQVPIQGGGQQPLQEIGGNQPVGQGQIISQTNEVVLQPTGQERVEVPVVQGPFVAEPDAIVEEIEAVEGLELPPGQVPQGLIEPVAQPAAPAYGGAPAYGTGYGSGGGGGGSMFCFTADTMVRLSSGEQKRMDELKQGDWVLSANGSQMVYANVESWIHRMPEIEADFHRIELTDGKVLKLTAKHYLYKTECTAEDRPIAFEKVNTHPVYAERVNEGDCLYAIPENEDGYFVQKRVKKVDIVTERGIYAPMTSNGDIVVNDIFASCFNILNNRVMQQSFVESISSLPSLRWIFGEQDEQISDLPFGTSLIVELMDYVLPTSFLAA
ncbi:Intein splicing protein [Aphelenchoides besseyi]|nr:Intein splicing protein [Aphelenchoides besseyi]